MIRCSEMLGHAVLAINLNTAIIVASHCAFGKVHDKTGVLTNMTGGTVEPKC